MNTSGFGSLNASTFVSAHNIETSVNDFDIEYVNVKEEVTNIAKTTHEHMELLERNIIEDSVNCVYMEIWNI